MAWSVEQVLSLAPDPASATAGKGLATPSKWESAGLNEGAAWGEAKGSGAKPYQTIASLSDGATKCSCPSRKFPCKHAIGLLIRVAQNQVSTAEAPSWVQDWLQKRGEKATPKAEKADTVPKPSNPKTVEKRWANIVQGLDECESFVNDAVHNGLLKMSSTRTWDQMAARMVDAQAPGIARRLRRIGETIGVGSDWGAKSGASLGNLSLLLQGARNIDTLGDLGHDIRSAVGIQARKQDLPEEGVTDHWDVFGVAVAFEERLVTYRTWLRGNRCGRWALNLTFAVGGVAPPRPLPGTGFETEAKFYLSAWPLRAQVEGFPAVSFDPKPGGNWEAALSQYALALAANPWIETFPVLLGGATLGLKADRWLVVDAEGWALPARISESARWALLAYTGNEPSELFGEFDGLELSVLSAWGPWGFWTA